MGVKKSIVFEGFYVIYKMKYKEIFYIINKYEIMDYKEVIKLWRIIFIVNMIKYK